MADSDSPNIKPSLPEDAACLHHGFGDTLAIFGLVAAMILWALVPSLLARAIVVVFAAVGLAYLAFKSHFVRSWTPKRKRITAVLLVVVLLVIAGFQLVPQWHHEQNVIAGSAPSSQADLVMVDKFAEQYRVAHPNEFNLDAERNAVNAQLAAKGFQPHNSYSRAPWGYVPNSEQCPVGVSHLNNSSAIRSRVGFDIQGNPCLVMDNDTTIDSDTGFKIRP